MTSGGTLVPIKQEIQDKETNSSVHANLIPPAKIKSEFVVVKQEPLSETELLSGIKCEINDGYYNNYESTLSSINPDGTVKVEEPSFNEIPTAPGDVSIKKCKTEQRVLTKYKCSCNKVFYDKFQHFRHMLDHTYENMTSVKCYICDRYFKTRNGMIAHVYSKHIGHRCKVCTWRFPTTILLMEHMELYHNYFVPRGHQPYSKMNKSHLRQMWEEKYRHNDSQMYSYTMLGIQPSSHIKIEPTYSNAEFGRITNIKTEPNWFISNVKTEPTFSNIKTEPIYPNIKVEPVDYSNVKVEPEDYSNIKVEPEDYSNVKVEPEDYSNIKVEPEDYSNVKVEPEDYSNVKVEPEDYSNVKVEPNYYSNVNVESTNYPNVKVEPGHYYSNDNSEPTHYSNVKIEPSYYSNDNSE